MYRNLYQQGQDYVQGLAYELQVGYDSKNNQIFDRMQIYIQNLFKIATQEAANFNNYITKLQSYLNKKNKLPPELDEKITTYLTAFAKGEVANYKTMIEILNEAITLNKSNSQNVNQLYSELDNQVATAIAQEAKNKNITVQE